MSVVGRRCVVWIGDYEPTDVAQRFAEFQRGLKLFAKTWRVSVRTSSFAMQDGQDAVAVWLAETKGANWKVDTEFRLYNWSDLVRDDFTGWRWDMPWRAAKAIGSFIASGTLFRYARTNWRFALLFSYPLLVMLAGLLVGLWIRGLVGRLGLPLPFVFGVAVGCGLILGFMRWVDPTVLRIVNLWIFLHDLILHKRKGLGQRIEQFSHDLEEQLRYQRADEILVVGHGIGAAMQPLVVDRAFWQFQEFGREGEMINLLSVGSQLLAVGLHPEADWLTGPVLRVSRDRMAFWADYQSKDDPLSFAGINPAKEMTDSDGKPSVRQVRFKEMTGHAARLFPLRLAYQNHGQFLRANAKRCAYDFFMICCGPIPLRSRVKQPEQSLSAFENDGKLRTPNLVTAERLSS